MAYKIAVAKSDIARFTRVEGFGKHTLAIVVALAVGGESRMVP